MSFPRYDSYRDSGTGWLREVPSHWEVFAGRRLFAQVRVPAREGDEQLSATQRYGVIPQTLFMALEDQKVVLALSGTDAFKHVDKDDFVISLRSFQGGIERSGYDGCVSPAYTVLKTVLPFEASFWAYLLKCDPFIAALQSVTDGIRDGKNVSYEQFGAIRLPHAPLEEQRAIAAFLDRETAKIDALVEAQRRLIELLKEKRQAVISHAVTKGLDPTVPMKDSGIEWLGKVPAHWKIVALKRIATSFCDGPFGSGLKSEHYSDKGVRVIRLQNIKADKFDDSDAAYIDQAYFDAGFARHEVIEGDLLIAGLGDDRNLVGRACVAPSDIAPAMVKADCFRFRLSTDSAVPAFVALQLSGGAEFAAGLLSSGSTRSRIPLLVMAGRKLALPSVEEQMIVTAWVEAEIARFDKLIDQAQSAITLLQERRAALISAAVTGKIDVRGLAAADAEAA